MAWWNPFKKDRAKSNESEPKIVQLQIGEYGGLVPAFVPNDGKVEESEAAISCISTNALYASKAEFSRVLIKSETGEKIPDARMNKILQLSPNPLCTAAVFWERAAHFFWQYNNAFIYIERDAFGDVKHLWSIDPSAVKFSKISTGEILLKFMLNGQELLVPYDEIIHIAKSVVKNPIFGMDACKPIKRVMNMIDLNYKGIENAILTSTLVRYIGEYVTKMSEDQLEEKAKKFTERYLRVDRKNPIGVVLTDSSLKLQPMTNGKQQTANYMEANQWNNSVYKYYGCPEKVIAGNATEEEMVAYYERTVEIFLMRAAQEMNRKLNTAREYDVGNRIIYSDRKIQYLSMATRLQIFNAAKELGVFTLGTLGDLIGLPVPSGKRNVVVTSQNYNASLENQNKPTTDDTDKDDKEE